MFSKRKLKKLVICAFAVVTSYLVIIAVIILAEHFFKFGAAHKIRLYLTLSEKFSSDVTAKSQQSSLSNSSVPNTLRSIFISTTRSWNVSAAPSTTPVVDERALDEQTSCKNLSQPPGEHIRYRHEHWQVLTNDHDVDIVVYSAFYDDRTIVGHPPWIRVLAVLKVDGSVERKLFCQVWYAESDTAYFVKVVPTITGRNHNIAGGRLYGQRLYSCRLQRELQWIPTKVSIALDECSPSTILLPVQRSVPKSLQPTAPDQQLTPPTSDVWQHEFAVCVEQLFGSFPPEVISEWIEAYRLFGVTRFNLYNGNVTSRETIRMIEHYADLGLVDWRPLPPSVDDYSEEGVRLSSPASLNDCMMRHMHTSRFVVVVDIDEIIVPRRHANYTSMLAHVDTALGLQSSYHVYTFRNAYFMRYFPEDESQPALLRTARFRRRPRPSEYMHRAKSFVDPRRCLSVYNHYCWIEFPHSVPRGSPSHGKGIDVDPEIALSHHYRYRCHDSDEMCKEYNRTKAVDDVMLQHRAVLEKRVLAAMEATGLSIKN